MNVLERAHVPSDPDRVDRRTGLLVSPAPLRAERPQSGWPPVARPKIHAHPRIQMKPAARLQTDAAEIEAERIADGLRYGSSAPPRQGRAADRSRGTDTGASATTPQAHSPSIVTDGLWSSGQPLEPHTRSAMEQRFGREFGHVRVHADSRAGRSAEAMGALAYTYGHDIIFGPGQYAPRTGSGAKLIAHELAHVVQQSGSAGTGTRIQRQAARDQDPGPRPLSLPEGLTLFPSVLQPMTLLGGRLTVPSRLRLTSALGLGPGPSAVLDISPRLLVLHLLENVDLSSSTRAGTPPGDAPTDENQQRISLLNPTLTFDPSTGRLRGWAILSIGSEYPLALRGPTDVRVEIESTELGAFSGRLGYGPLTTDFRLRLHYDTTRLENAIGGAFAPQGGLSGFWTRLQTILRGAVPGIRLDRVDRALLDLLREVQIGQLDGAAFTNRVISVIGGSIPAGASLETVRAALSNLADELRQPGYTLSGTARLWPLPFPISGYSVTAPTRVPLARPLPGAPAPYPITASAGGVIVAPPGAIKPMAVPALGYTRTSFDADSGSAFTAALLPTLSVDAIGAGEPLARQFPVFAYVEYSYVRRISNSLDLGFRLTAQVSTAQFAATAPAAADPAERLRQSIQVFQETSKAGDTPPTPNVGLTVTGQFDAF